MGVESMHESMEVRRGTRFFEEKDMRAKRFVFFAAIFGCVLAGGCGSPSDTTAGGGTTTVSTGGTTDTGGGGSGGSTTTGGGGTASTTTSDGVGGSGGSTTTTGSGGTGGSAAVCGNGIPEPGEGCDDGNEIEGDGCDSNCTPTGCGNAIQTPGEECDDGNLIDGDGCSGDCKLGGCGDGMIDPGEECDDFNKVDGDACTNACTINICGDGVKYIGVEQCDDKKNGISGDGCEDNCSISLCLSGILVNPVVGITNYAIVADSNVMQKGSGVTCWSPQPGTRFASFYAPGDAPCEGEPAGITVSEGPDAAALCPGGIEVHGTQAGGCMPSTCDPPNANTDFINAAQNPPPLGNPVGCIGEQGVAVIICKP